MADISLVIIAKNEERTIGDVLSGAAPLAREIIFVDSGSTDRTVDIAKSFGVKFLHQDWLGYAAQKNFAIDQAGCQWILSLDADEVVTPELVAEIESTLADRASEKFTGYTIPRVLYIGNTPVRHGGFYPDAQLRLFRRGKGRFNNRAVHEAVKIDGNIGRLKNEMHHYAYADVSGFAAAMEKYARLSAEHYYAKGDTGWRASWLNEALHPCWTFFYRTFVRGGILDGELGIKLNLIYAQYVRNKIRYLRELMAARAALPQSPVD